MSTQSEAMSLDEIIEDSQITSAQAKKFSSFKMYKSGDLRSIDELHPKFRHIFQYPYFNKIQSKILDDVLYTDKSLVVSAPTGSGKTVLLELAIVRLLMVLEELNYNGDFKIVYMAPVKALCTERLSDWYGKFSKLGLPCIEVTGDTDSLDFRHLKFYKIIMTTPEKWDSLTRRWKDHKLIVQMVKLFIIDEVHLLNEDVRGPVLEAVVSRMKTIQSSLTVSKYAKKNKESYSNNVEDENVAEFNVHSDDSEDQLPLEIRFIAVSATIPNAEDIAEWLGTKECPAACYKIGEEYRPVKLKKVVEGFPFKDGQGLFKFDMYLSYKLRPIIERYCDGKPTLIFCNTRKSVVMTAEVLSKELMFQFSQEQSSAFAQMASRLSEKKLQVLVRSGIGCHHAGFIQSDRNIIEQMFRQGNLPLLITTSTLSMGVNLPAHLVIIKTTQFYNNGAYQEYEESTVLQMMGRAGRPQFDTEGVAVILTKLQDKNRYVSMCGGTRCVESALHRHLSEHLNAEAALGTLADLLQAMDWIRSTFLYVRAVRNPAHYGYPATTKRDTIEKRLEELCLKCVNALARAGMLTMDSNTVITSTEAGVLMAAHCLDFETMRLIIKIKGTETLSELLGLLSMCHEYSDVPLRAGEKRCLNLLNRRPRGQAAEGAAGSCRFPLPGRIQTRDMKVNCLIQAIFGSLPIPDPSLNQEAAKLLRIGDHISKCIVNYITRPSVLAENIDKPIYQSVLNSVILAKCFAARLWENSCFMVRQLSGIGPILATLLVSAGKVTFESIRQSNPRDLERIINKLPPSGNILKKQVALLPLYKLDIKCETNRVVQVTLSIANYDQLLGHKSTAGENHRVTLIVGDSENNLLLFEKILDTTILETDDNEVKREVTPKCSLAHTVNVHCISNTWVGLDVKNSVNVKKTLFSSLSGNLQQNIQQYVGEKIRGSIKFKDADDIIQEEMMEAIADFSPQIQTDFLNEENDFFESNDDQQNKKDEQGSSTAKKKPRIVKKLNKPKSPVQKNCDVAKGGKNIMEKINKYLKSIPEPSSLNTLSANVTYYRPLPKSIPQEHSLNKLKENISPLNESSEINGNRDCDANTSTICPRNPNILRVKNSSSDDNRTQQQNVVKSFHPQTDIDKPVNKHSLHRNSYYDEEYNKLLRKSKDFPLDVKENNLSHNFNKEKYSSTPNYYEYEQIPLVKETFNGSEDETYEDWYKMLDTQNTRESFVSKVDTQNTRDSFVSKVDTQNTRDSFVSKVDTQNTRDSFVSKVDTQNTRDSFVSKVDTQNKRDSFVSKVDTQNTKVSFVSEVQGFNSFPSQIDDSFSNYSITEKDANIHSRDSNYLTYSKSQLSSQQNNLQPVIPSPFSKRDYSFKQSAENFKNTQQSNTANDSNNLVFENNKREAPNYQNRHYETFHISTLQYPHVPEYGTENFKNTQQSNITNDPNKHVFENNKREAPNYENRQYETFHVSTLQYPHVPHSTENFKNTQQSKITNDPNKHVFENNKREAQNHENRHYETFHISTLQYPQSIGFPQNRSVFKENVAHKRIAPQTETFQSNNKKSKKISTYGTNHIDQMKECEISMCEKNQWIVPKTSTDVRSSPGNGEKINLMKPNDPQRLIISYIDLTEDLETTQCGENSFIKVDFNKETKPNKTTCKVPSDNYCKYHSITRTKKLEDESKIESEFNNVSLNKLTITVNQPLNSIVNVAKRVQNNFDLSKNICEKGIGNLSAFNKNPEKKQTVVCEEKVTNAIETQTSSINFKQNNIIENPIKKSEQKKVIYQALSDCEMVNSSDDEIIFVENLTQPQNKIEIKTENLVQSEDGGCKIVGLNFLDKIQCYKSETQSPNFFPAQKQSKQNAVQNFVKCDSVQQNNSMEYYYKPTNVNIQYGNQIHITNHFQKLHRITFNTVPRPLTFGAYPKRYKCKKFKSVTWRAPLVVLPPRAGNVLTGNVTNEIQNEEFSLVNKNASLVMRNHKFEANITAKRPIMSVMKSVMELPLKKLISLYSFNTTANNIIEISVDENIGKTMYNSSQYKIRELEDDKPMSLFKKHPHKPIIELANDVSTLKKIAEKRISQIIESNDAGNEVDITREVSSSLEHKTELLFAKPSLKICNKDSYVKEWLKKSPFNCFPNLDPDTNEIQTACKNIEMTKDSEEEKTIGMVNENPLTTENILTSMITSSLLKHKQKQDSVKLDDKNNEFDRIEDLESNWEKDCKLPNANKIKSSERKKSQKQSINSVMNYNAQFVGDIYADAPNRRDNIQGMAIQNDNITLDYQQRLENYASVCNHILKNDTSIKFDNEDKEEDWIKKIDEDLAGQNMYDSDNNEIIDQNLFNPQNVIASAYCSNRNMEDTEIVNLSQGEYERTTTSEVSFQLFQHKTIENVVEYLQNDTEHSYNENFLKNVHIPSARIESGNSESPLKYYEPGIQGSHFNIKPKNLERRYENATQNAGQNQYSSFKNVSNDYSRSLFGNFYNYNSPSASQSNNMNMGQAQNILKTHSQPTVSSSSTFSTQMFHLQNSNNQGQFQFRSQVRRQNVSGNPFFSQFEKPTKDKFTH